MDTVSARLEALENALEEVRAENRELRSRQERVESRLGSWRRIAGLFMAVSVATLGLALMPAAPAVAQTTLEQRVTALEQKLLYVSRVGRDMVFNAVNVHIRNGGRTTESVNSLGNLIVGFNELRNDRSDNRTGSHNLIVGQRNNYSSYGSLVAGSRNTVSGPYSSVSGGYRGTASGPNSSVSGGNSNTASSWNSSVSGGFANTASGGESSVSGGEHNTAGGPNSSVSGGQSNTAGGTSSSVSGGQSRSTIYSYNWRAGGIIQEQ